MSDFFKMDIKDLMSSVNMGEYSHLIVCLNRNIGTFFFRFVEKDEDLARVISELSDDEVYRIISVNNINDCIFDCDKCDEDICKVNEALEYATKMHEGQYRKDGTEYITHPIRVANYVSLFKTSSNMDVLLESAYLHDTLEDTSATYYDIIKQFGPRVASIVLELTNDDEVKNTLGKTNYLKIKMTNMSSWALVVKLCDRLDNVSDLSYADETFRKRYVKETVEIVEHLINNRELNETHMAIINSIMDCVKNYRVDNTYNRCVSELRKAYV